jgi:hypothetical protein
MWLAAVELVSGSLRFTPRKQCKSDHGNWGLQKVYFQACIIHYHSPKGFGVGEPEEILSLQMSGTMIEKCILLLFNYRYSGQTFHNYEKRREEGEKVKHAKKFSKFSFVTYILKNSAHPFLVHRHFSWSTFGLHLVRGLKVLKCFFLRNRAIKVWS